VLVFVVLAALKLEEIAGQFVIMQTLLAHTGEGLCNVSQFSEKWSKYQVYLWHVLFVIHMIVDSVITES
jgi:hypothetical protein